MCIRLTYCLKLNKLIVFRDKKDMALFQTKHMTTIKKQYYGVSAGYLKQLSKNIIELFTNISVK